MRRYKKKLKNVLEDIVCDICGKSCIPSSQEDVGFAEFAVLEANWGYFSRKDETSYNCEICEDCFDKLNNFIEGLKSEVN